MFFPFSLRFFEELQSKGLLVSPIILHNQSDYSWPYGRPLIETQEEETQEVTVFATQTNKNSLLPLTEDQVKVFLTDLMMWKMAEQRSSL